MNREKRSSGAKTGCGKGTILGQLPEKHASGPKGPFDFMAVMYGLKPVPFKAMSFSAASKAHFDFVAFSAVRAEALSYQSFPFKAATFSAGL